MPPEQQPFTPYAPEGATTPESAPPAPPAPFVAQGASEDEKYSTPGWSWGAFMFGPMFLIAVRKYTHLWFYALPLLFLFGVMALFGLRIVPQVTSGGNGAWAIFSVMVPILIGIGVLSFLALPIYFGIKGRMLAADSRTFSNKDQYVGFMKVMDHAGKVGFFVFLGVTVLSFVFLGVSQSMLPQDSGEYGSYGEYESSPYDFEN